MEDTPIIFSFPDNYAVSHVSKLTKFDVEYVKIGYRKGSFKAMLNISHTRLFPNDYIEKLRQNCFTENLVIIAHSHNLTKEDVRELQ